MPNFEEFIKKIKLKATGDQAALFYKKEKEIRTPISSFVQQILKNKQKCLYIDKKENYQGLGLCGELNISAEPGAEKEEIIKYDRRLKARIFNKYPLTGLCSYNIDRFNSQTIKTLIELHNYIVWQGDMYENPYYIDFNDKLKNRGEVENFEFEARKNNGQQIYLNMNAQIKEKKRWHFYN